jgi:hypothetical protein
MLARLLATEDLIVEHKKVETASFNVNTRVLTLPLWEKASDDVYNMLVLHEISHSLWTPNIDWTKDYNIPPNFVNICEDVRVEQLCKRRYPGSPKTFYNGYKELVENDFFEIENKNIDKFNLADRVNLYFKIGSFLSITFSTDEELDIVKQISDAETFDEVLIASERLYNYCKKEIKNQPKNESDQLLNPPLSKIGISMSSDGVSDDDQLELVFDSDSKDDDSDENDSGNGASNSDSDSKDDDSDKNDSGNGASNSDSDSKDDDSDKNDSGNGASNSDSDSEDDDKEPEVETMNSLEESLKSLIDPLTMETVYLEIPNLNLDKIVIPNSEIHSICKQEWGHIDDSIFSAVDMEFEEFKKNSQREVSYLVKEFECHKSADSYARASTSKTGVLDCNKLHTYKFNSDIFKRVTNIPGGKNHGLVFILDWSGSMDQVILDTIKQLYNLIWFCKRVSIPFEVYAFTNSYNCKSYHDIEESYVPKHGLIRVSPNFSLMNLFTSKTKNSDLNNQLRNIFRIASKCFKHYKYYYNVPHQLCLSGTPLNESLIALHQILPKFKNQNNLQKVHCVILTDGGSSGLNYHCDRIRDGSSYLGKNYIADNSYLRDRKSGHSYKFSGSPIVQTNTLLKNLRDSYPDMSFIGIRLIESRDVRYFVRLYYDDMNKIENLMNQWSKEKCLTIKTSGYHSYFTLSAKTLSQDSKFDVPEDSTRTQIKSAFVKSLKVKKMNKRILGEFIELIS